MFPKVVKRIIAKMSVKNARIFSDEELAKLVEAFSLTTPELNDCLGALHYALSQAAYSSLKPAVLAATLTAAQMAADHAAAMSDAWEKEGAGVIKRLRDASVMGAPKVMLSTDWSLSINMASSTVSDTKAASARFEMDLARPNGGGEEETLAVEFSHEELYEFFKKLEKVQSQLDDLN